MLQLEFVCLAVLGRRKKLRKPSFEELSYLDVDIKGWLGYLRHL